MTYAPVEFEVNSSMVKEEMHLQENKLTFDPNVKVAQNFAQLSLHYVIYAPAKFAVATSNGLGGD